MPSFRLRSTVKGVVGEKVRDDVGLTHEMARSKVARLLFLLAWACFALAPAGCAIDDRTLSPGDDGGSTATDGSGAETDARSDARDARFEGSTGPGLDVSTDVVVDAS